ncbi:MAG: 3-keto-disaccharide hydrolase [Verrucomicrobiales bacterium]
MIQRIALSLLALAVAVSQLQAASLNELTPDEKKAGWKLLFDGKSTQGWRNFKKSTFPEKGWIVENGILKHVDGISGGDIITEEKFDQFELSWEWMIPKGANNGIKYFITEERGSAIGHEYQMIDDLHGADTKNPKHKTASFYDVLPPLPHNALKSPGEWNHSRVVVQGNQVEHWLNGSKVLEYELGSEEIKAAVAHSKFKSVPGFGSRIKGHILLTDHKDEANFRNIKIRDLNEAKTPQ